MAKRSDFAQKLLDDLRLRKEKLGFASSSQRSTLATSGGAYVNSQRSFQGPVEATTSKLSGKNMVDTEVTKLWIGTRHHKTTAQEGTSRAIVPVGRATNAERTVDVSMALALALSKTGKLQNIELFTNATVGNERILHRGSISFRENNGRCMSDKRNSVDQHPFLSHQQIGEISKGVQKLNKILETCSNGPKFSRDSIDLGRELLRGAMDLESSLRMLVTLQEASDYMVGSQGKQVRLLKDKDEDESSSNTSRKKSTNRPRFSSDGFQEQSSLALSYPRKSKTPTTSNKSSPNTSMQFVSHRRSLSCGPGFGPDAQFSGISSTIREEPRSTSSGKYSSTPETFKQLGSKGSPACEKVRIPNVVAKLMGLEELPVPPPKADGKNGEAQKVPNLKKETEMGKTLIADTGVGKKEVDMMTSLQKNIFKTGGQNKVPQEKGIREDKVAHSQGKTNLKSLIDIENTSPASNYLPASSLKISKQMDIANTAHSKKDRVTKKEVKESRENASIKEQMSKVKVEQTIHDVKKPILVNQDDAARKKDSLQKYEINFQDRFSIQNDSLTTANDDVPKHISTVHRVESKYSVHDSAMETGHDGKNKPETKITLKSDPKLKKAEKSTNEMSRQKVFSGSTVITASKRSSSKSAKSEKPKDDPKRSHQEKPRLWNRRSTYHEADRKAAKGNLEKKKTTMTDLRIDKEKAMPPIPVTAMKKPVYILPTVQKVDTADTTVHRGESNRIYEGRSENIENPNAEGQHLKEQTTIPDELEHRWKERTNKTDRAKVSIHTMNSDKHLQQQIESTTISNSKHIDDSRHTTKTPEKRSATETNSYTIIDLATDTQRSPQVSQSNYLEPQPFKLNGKESEGPIDIREISSNSNLLESQTRAVSEVEGQGSLTKNQCLMQVLVNNQHFLNTLLALFKLKIPIGFLKDNENSCPVKDNKFLLDCGYELIRRKGKREEVTYAMSMSYAPMKVRCLDTLITELNDDLESLKFQSNIEDNNYDTADFLQKMLEKDIQNRNPDVNCMWDLGWNTMILGPVVKDEVIRDVEKHVLNALINELARDLIEESITVF